jgi:catechol 2,3-dioxygenase-like lactoylglutathione lyase family enzyme
MTLQIVVTSVLVDDQEKARRFYTEVLGFQLKHDVDMGGPRWLTVVSPDAPDGAEALPEPMVPEFARTFQRELYAAGIPLTMFGVEDVEAEYARLKALGVVFRGEPKQMGPVKAATFEDTCGNLIMMAERTGE